MEQQIIKKLGLQNDKNLLEKTTELLRLLELKSSTVISGVNECAKISICIDLAATLLTMSIDLIDVIKQSGLKKSAYEKYKRTFQKILEINKPPGINEICINLNCNEVVEKAHTLLNLYKNYVQANNENDIDLSHPQYAAMAVFEACKLNKVKIMKTKILRFSYLRPSQWSRLEQQWDKLIKEHDEEFKLNTKNKVKNKSDNSENNKAQQVNENKTESNLKRDEFEDYAVWRAKIIKKAKQDLKLIQQEHIEKNIQSMEFDDSF